MTTAMDIPHYSYGRLCEFALKHGIRVRCGHINPSDCKWCADLIIASVNPPRLKKTPPPHDCFGHFDSLCKHCWSCKVSVACIDGSNIVPTRLISIRIMLQENCRKERSSDLSSKEKEETE